LIEKDHKIEIKKEFLEYSTNNYVNHTDLLAQDRVATGHMNRLDRIQYSFHCVFTLFSN